MPYRENKHQSINFGLRQTLDCITLSTTYLKKTDVTREHVIKEEERFPISGQGYINGKLLDQTECSILIDTGTSKSYMLKSYYMQCKSLHALSKFASTRQRIQVGNRQYVVAKFVIPVMIDMHGHRFEMFTLVSEIHDNVDLVLGMKNVFELEGVIDMWHSSFKYLNISILFFSKEQVIVKPRERMFIKIEAPFVDEISGLAIVKMLDNKEQCTVVLKLKFIRNQASLDITSNMQETVIFEPKQILGILDLGSLGYYKIEQGILQQNLSKCYHVESAEKLCEEFKILVNERKKEEREIEENQYPWLDDSDEGKYMMDKEILDKHLDLDNSCLTELEKVQVRDMIYEYREAFSLRDEIGTCGNIQIDIDIMDRIPFFIRPYHVKEEDKRILDKEMKRLCYLGILKEGFSAYSSPVMLISRKMTQDNRVVTDFRHLNTRIAKNNLAYPLVKDTFTMLGNSKCEVLLVLDLKDAFHSLRLSEKSRKYCGILPYFGSVSCLYQRIPMGFNVSPLIWQTYINTILNYLESRKYCEAIMDDLLLFTPSKQLHMRKLEDLLMPLLKNGLKISPRKCQLSRKGLQYMGNIIFIQEKRVCVKPLCSRLEAIQKLKPPTTVKGCRSFVRMINFLSIFCQDFQKLLTPIYDLTHKDRPFNWGQQ